MPGGVGKYADSKYSSSETTLQPRSRPLISLRCLGDVFIVTQLTDTVAVPFCICRCGGPESNARPELRGAEDVRMRTGRAIRRPVQADKLSAWGFTNPSSIQRGHNLQKPDVAANPERKDIDRKSVV